MHQDRYKLVIVGAGFAGLGLAYKLKQSGIEDFIILEKADGVGGTWRHNTYPGAECDIASSLYSYSFAPNPGWDFKWSKQPQILSYIESFARDNDILRHVKFGQAVKRADYTDGRWIIKTQDGEVYNCQFFVSAIGQLHHPSVPDFDGKADYKGPSFHSAQWDHSVDLSGQNVAVIGVGASAAQLIPEVAKIAKHLTVYQRSPNWIINKHDRPYSRFEKWLAKKVPVIAKLYRGGLWCQGEYFIWPVIKGAKLRGALVRGLNALEIKAHVKDAEKRTKLKPDYPVGAKRILLSDTYYKAIGRDNVTLETDGIARIQKAGIQTKTSKVHPHDVIIYATGFHTNPFLKEIAVTGEAGTELREHWNEGAFAYLGVTTSGFPNMFMLYGPNTNTGHTSIIYKLEAQFEHILKLIAKAGEGMVSVSKSAEDAYNTEAQEKLSKLAWAKIEASWYKDGARVTNNWHGGSVEFKRRLESPIYEHFTFSHPISDKTAAE
ncbi:flavin-containing monooxygenase [Hellea balneolensis]|uniref:flavin-containing monooxygenase n=1 Tax=Hellea balneolensis TaxID=287478 RepID=UPI000423F5CF|nr:NAD(P)/FAD-dependent oxidoreductase [Hellea balneolensis]